MNIVCTSKKEQIASFYDEMANSYIDAFGRPPWNERSKCRAEYLTDRQNCVGKLSQLAVGQFCVDCGRTPNEPAYSVGECQQAFDALLAKGAVFYIESELEPFVFATIGIVRDSPTLVGDKYDDEVMATAIDDIIGSELFVWLEESFANLSLRPSGNMKNRYAAVLALASQLGCERIATVRSTLKLSMLLAETSRKLSYIFPMKSTRLNLTADWRYLDQAAWVLFPIAEHF